MEQDIQPQQFASPTSFSDEDKIKLSSDFLKKHKVISVILGLLLIFAGIYAVFKVWNYFVNLKDDGIQEVIPLSFDKKK
jgi:hypothetical protein